MGGFLGVGGNSANTDRSNQLQDNQNIFNQILGFTQPQGESSLTSGSGTLNQAKGALAAPQAYWQGVLAPGRTAAATNAAPATNAVQQQTDAVRNQEAAQGTSRGGGTASQNREASSTADQNIDNIINQNMMGGRQAAATGLTQATGTEAGIGATQERTGEDLTSLAQAGNVDLLNNATSSRPISEQINQQTASGYGQALGGLIKAGLAFA